MKKKKCFKYFKKKHQFINENLLYKNNVFFIKKQMITKLNIIKLEIIVVKFNIKFAKKKKFDLKKLNILVENHNRKLK